MAEYESSSDFTPAERAALTLADSMTRHAGEVTDEAWAEAASHFDEGELIEIVAVIAAFNALNRMANAMRVEVTR